MVVTEAQLVAAGIGVLVGLVIGALLVALVLGRRLAAARTGLAVLETRVRNQEDLEDERSAMLELAGQRLGAKFDDVANRSLEVNSATFLRLARENLGRHQVEAQASLSAKQKAVEQLVAPLTQALERTRQHVEQAEKDRHAAYGGVTAQLRHLGEAQRSLQTETANLVTALRRPEVRGRWGEVTLRRVVELAGMVEHCDFEQQAQTDDGGALRPDLVVRLPENRTLVIDAKTPLDAYLSAIEAPTEDARKVQLDRHARQLRERIRELASKSYWQQFRTSPEFAVLFLPGDQFLSNALARDASILDDALRQKIIVATPSSLMALLKTVSYGWRQLELNENAGVIRELGEELYRRLANFTAHLAKVGQTLGQSVAAYNSAVGSLERQVLPGARRFTELGVDGKKDVADLPPVDNTPRVVTTDDDTIAEPTDASTDTPAAGDGSATNPVTSSRE